ncbi:MAG: hypothetical protein GY765_25620 [bacterium]|nr:hypothetical protein [bacterium]
MSPRKSEMKKTKLGVFIGNNLLTIKEINKWTHQQMADKMGVVLWTFRSYTKGNNTPLARTLYRVGANLGISLDWLVMGRGKMLYKPPYTEKELVRGELEKMLVVMETVPAIRDEMKAHYEKLKEVNGNHIREELKKKNLNPENFSI